MGKVIADDDIARLERAFVNCRKILSALGDSTRQYLLCAMLHGQCNGSRVANLAANTNLSRPAISHHMQILKDAGVVKSRKEGTYIYYYLDPEAEKLNELISLFSDAELLVRRLPDRS